MAVLTTTASLLAFTSLVFSITLAFDWILHVFRPQVKPGAITKEWSSEESCAAMLPLSTRTLGLQTITLSFLTLCLFAILIPSTFIVRTHSAHLTTQNDMPTSIDVRYWDYGFRKHAAVSHIYLHFVDKRMYAREKCDAWPRHHGLVWFSRFRQASLRGERGIPCKT